MIEVEYHTFGRWYILSESQNPFFSSGSYLPGCPHLHDRLFGLYVAFSEIRR